MNSRTLKMVTWIILIAGLIGSCVTGKLHAQDTLLVEWNLEGKQDEVLLKGPSLTFHGDKSVWERPTEDYILEVLVTSPAEQGFGRKYEHREFKQKLSKEGWGATPKWLVVQMYMTIKDQESPLWFLMSPQKMDYGGWTGFYLLGPNNRLDKRHDIYWGQSRQKYANTQKWVFCRKVKKP